MATGDTTIQPVPPSMLRHEAALRHGCHVTTETCQGLAKSVKTLDADLNKHGARAHTHTRYHAAVVQQQSLFFTHEYLQPMIV